MDKFQWKYCNCPIACVRAHCTAGVTYVNPSYVVLAVFQHGIDLLKAARHSGPD